MGFKDILFMLLAHHSRDNLSHTIRIPIGKRSIYLCARCTAIYTALTIAFLVFTFAIDLTLLNVWGVYSLAFIFGTPVIISWSWQTITNRDNSNRIRILTGLGGGIGLAILLYTPTPLRELSIFAIFGVVFLVLYFGKIRRFKKDDQEFEREIYQGD